MVLSPEEIGALGIVETFSASSVMVAADVAASVTIFRLSLAMAMGGKGLLMMTGSVAAAAAVAEHGLLVSTTVIPRPSKELFTDYI